MILIHLWIICDYHSQIQVRDQNQRGVENLLNVIKPINSRTVDDKYAYLSVKGLRHNPLKRHTHMGENSPTLNTVIYIFKNEKDHCVLTTYLILFCGGCRQLCLSFVFCENLNETKNSKDKKKKKIELWLKTQAYWQWVQVLKHIPENWVKKWMN